MDNTKATFDRDAARKAFDDWRNNGPHAASLGGDPAPIYGSVDDPGSGECANADEFFIRHEAFAAFRAGMRYAKTGSPFNVR